MLPARVQLCIAAQLKTERGYGVFLTASFFKGFRFSDMPGQVLRKFEQQLRRSEQGNSEHDMIRLLGWRAILWEKE